jgi:hypothetical protein
VLVCELSSNPNPNPNSNPNPIKLYLGKIDKIDESSKLFLYKNLEPSIELELKMK